jgi:hypothetical protein
VFSTNSEGQAEVILDREYLVALGVFVDGVALREGETALVSFQEIDGERTASASLPEIAELSLSEGLYEVDVQVYGGAEITIPASKTTECFETQRGLLGGLLGLTKEECVTVDIPATTLDSALRGGGKQEIYLFPSDLAKGNVILRAGGLTKPTSLEQLQYNMESFEDLSVEVVFG